MANAAVSKRIEKFIEECKEKMTLGAMDAPRMKSAGFAKKLIEEIGEEDLAKASFEEIISSLDGCGIAAIENYIQKMDEENALTFQENLPKDLKEQSVEKAPEPAPEKNAKKESAPEEKAEPVKDAVRSAKQAEGKEKKEPTRKQAQKPAEADADVFSILEEHKSVSAADKERLRELKKSLYLLERQKNIVARGVSAYRKDFNFLSGLDRYSKFYPTEIAGVSINGMTSILHAASILLLRELAAGDNAELIKAIRENSDARDAEVIELQKRIDNVKKDIDSLS